MKQTVTQGIILTRTNFGEADRIVTIITSDQGKIRGLAKGVRKVKSKLAGGIELFSISHISILVGKGEINTLMSTRLENHFGNIVKEMERTKAGYEFMRLLNKATAEAPEEAYFDLLASGLASLDDLELDYQLSDIWFMMQLLKLTGHGPNLRSAAAGQQLLAGGSYNFSFDKMCFAPDKKGKFKTRHIKFLRLGFGDNSPKALSRIDGVEKLTKDCQQLVLTALQTHLRV